MKTFNPPPNWPTPPEGWTPPPDWQPDPSWGPAPAGWNLWLDDQEGGAKGNRGKNRRTLKVLGVAVGAIVAISVVSAALSGNGPETQTAFTAAAKPSSSSTTTSPTPQATTPSSTTTSSSTTRAAATARPKPTKALTAAQENAIGAAKDYLSFQAFSRKGLIQQLSSSAGDGFAVKDATFAVDHLKVNWNEQAARAAKEYLSMMHFSRNGLIQQLESSAGDGYTHAQAVYGVKKAGL